MHPGVVADVDDGRQLMRGRTIRCSFGKLAEAEVVLDAEQESGAADSADQNGDLHIDRD